MISSEYRQEISYGIIPLRKKGDAWEVLLIQHGSAGYWGFPKGHPEDGEPPQNAAIRELREETNLEIVRFLSESILEEHYTFKHQGRTIQKTVRFYVAEVEGKVILQKDEVGDSIWIPLEKAETQLTYDNDKSISRAVLQILEGK